MLLQGLVACAALLGARMALAECGVSGASALNAPEFGPVIAFRPSSTGLLGASLDRANEVAPYIRINVYPELDELRNKPFDSSGGSVYYLEQGPHGRRICRAEEWKRRSLKMRDKAVPDYLHPAVKGVYPYFEMHQANTIQYNPDGSLASIQLLDAAGRKTTRFCALYDAQGRIEVASQSSGVALSDHPDFHCSQLRDSPPRGMTWYFTYRADGALVSVTDKEATRKRGEEPDRDDTGRGTEATDGAWTANGYMYVDVANRRREVAISFHGSDRQGLQGVQDSSAAIVPSDATTLFAQRSRDVQQKLEYTFPGERVPMELATGLFEGVTKYSRVREYRHRSHSRIFEVFAPGSSRPRERQWRTLDLNRQENYDANSKLTRVILSGPVSGDAYTENLRAYAEKGVLKLTPLTNGYSSYRVYDYDAAGKETLSFVCWRYEVSTNKPYAHFPWWEPDHRPKRSREDELQYGRTQVGTRCGTPDGKMIVEGMGPVKKLMETKYGFGTTKLGLPGE